jgi:hypothetical protein
MAVELPPPANLYSIERKLEFHGARTPSECGERRPMAVDDELESLNVRIRQLRVQFDLFFSGALPKPPLEVRDVLDKEIKRVGAVREMKLAQRFLYNTLLNRWNIFTELWNKKLKEREEGVRTPVVARRRAAERQESPLGTSPDAAAVPRRPPGAPPERRLLARAAIREVVDISGVEMKAFYKSFLEARQEAGGGKAPSYEKFCEQLQKQVRTLREKTACEKVDFRLYLEENKVSLKAMPVQNGAAGRKENRG